MARYENGGQRYYNVVHWMDCGIALPKLRVSSRRIAFWQRVAASTVTGCQSKLHYVRAPIRSSDLETRGTKSASPASSN
jgi:hypothetical protein